MKRVMIKKIISRTNTKNEDELRLNLYTVYCEYILSREVFKLNKDIKSFLEKNNMFFKDYVYASRTVIISKVIRKIENGQKEDLNLYYENIKNELFEELSVPTKKRKNTVDDLDEILNQFGD